ncbi:MAG: alpha/beta hydrolase [Chthonomonas sp.]|nr:alpha/beta hydrolase [Chthonomonas sp.]
MVAAAIVTLLLSQERPSTLTGTVRQLPDFESKILGNKRTITTWLPPGYQTSTARYPVLIMLDGQNLFDGAKSFIPGEEWRADETAAMLIEAKLAEPFIIVGVDNTGASRMDEYTTIKTERGAGKGDAFGRFLTDELMPVIHKSFRTKTGAANLGIAGASLGGLISLHLGLTRPAHFGRIGGVSPSVWWGDRHLLKTAATFKGTRPKVWLDIGTSESRDAAPDARALRDVLVRKGWILGKDLVYVQEIGGEHNERAWARRLGEMMIYLFPKK